MDYDEVFAPRKIATTSRTKHFTRSADDSWPVEIVLRLERQVDFVTDGWLHRRYARALPAARNVKKYDEKNNDMMRLSERWTAARCCTLCTRRQAWSGGGSDAVWFPRSLCPTVFRLEVRSISCLPERRD